MAADAWAWIGRLKVGDPVVVLSFPARTLARVARVTARGVVCVEPVEGGLAFPFSSGVCLRWLGTTPACLQRPSADDLAYVRRRIRDVRALLLRLESLVGVAPRGKRGR